MKKRTCFFIHRENQGGELWLVAQIEKLREVLREKERVEFSARKNKVARNKQTQCVCEFTVGIVFVVVYFLFHYSKSSEARMGMVHNVQGCIGIQTRQRLARRENCSSDP